MDLVRELKDVRFELSLRGYDCEAVDAFLAKLRADITSLQEQNDSSSARIRELETAVQDGGGAPSETEGTLRRTLVLAQRLADETEAEAKKDASDMREAAANETEQMRLVAESESTSMREEGKRELGNARDEAASIRETVAEEAARLRAETRVESDKILAEAERRGMERVAALEQTAQVEVATMREPIRAEVGELEGARARVMDDIAGLESHLEQQRVRVRTAVEALRVGMSGSIEDLERVAEDDDLLATRPTPATSGAGERDVSIAPDIDIVDRVADQAPDAPSSDEVEDAIRAAAKSSADLEAAVDTPDLLEDSDVSVEELDGTVEELDVTVEGDDTDDKDATEAPEAVVEDIEVPDAEIVLESLDDAPESPGDDQGPATEPIPIVGDHEFLEEPGSFEQSGVVTDTFVESDEADEDAVIELGDEPSSLFGTDLSADAEAVSVDDGGDAAVPFVMATGYEDNASEDGDMSADQGSDGPNFVERFAELLDAHPVRRDQ